MKKTTARLKARMGSKRQTLPGIISYGAGTVAWLTEQAVPRSD
jgi:hypothetical protein